MLEFFLRKLISSLLYPPTFCLVIALLGWILLLGGRFTRIAKGVIGASLITLLLLSIPALQKPAIRLLEASGTKTSAENIDAIVVLGAGVYEWEDGAPATKNLGATSLSRAIEGIRLAKKYPETPLIFTGGTIGDRPASSASMADLAIDLGIPEEQIITFSTPTSTWEEAQRTAAELGTSKVILVSSALHLPRAILLFEKSGISASPSPTDYLSDPSPSDILDFLPNAGAWLTWQRAFHEIYGRIWFKFTKA